MRERMRDKAKARLLPRMYSSQASGHRPSKPGLGNASTGNSSRKERAKFPRPARNADGTVDASCRDFVQGEPVRGSTPAWSYMGFMRT